MGLVLGYDGKQRALQASLGTAPSAIGTIYVGFLQSAPADMDGMTLATLVSAGQGNEFSINANFYTGRKAITFSPSITVNATGATTSNSGADITWTNTSGSAIEIKGLFITSAASGTSGQVLWVGTPDIGTGVLNNGETVTISAGIFEVKID